MLATLVLVLAPLPAAMVEGPLAPFAPQQPARPAPVGRRPAPRVPAEPTALDAEVALAAERFGLSLERVSVHEVGSARVATAVYTCPLGAGSARLVVHDELGVAAREVDWLQPEREYHDGWLTVGPTAERRDGRVALEVAAALLASFRGVAGTTLSLVEHPGEPYRFWTSIELEPGDGRHRPEAVDGGTLTWLDGHLRLMTPSVGLRPAQLEALAGLALRARTDGARIVALGVRAVDPREVEPPFWPPAEVVLATTAYEGLEGSSTARLERFRLEQSGSLRRLEDACLQRDEPGGAAWSLGGDEVRLLAPRGPWCLSGAGPDDFEPASVRLRGQRYRVVLGVLAR